MLINYLFYTKRYQLNITRPNIYIFEYESQILNPISLYNILNAVIYILSLFIFYLSFENFFKIDAIDFYWYKKLLTGIVTFLIAKNILTYVLYHFNKQNNKFKKLRFINTTYNTYLGLYLFLFSFFFFYFPYKNKYLLWIIISISMLFIISTWFNIFQNYNKHFYMKSYKLFLYLCLTEILPLITLIGWISFQIL